MIYSNAHGDIMQTGDNGDYWWVTPRYRFGSRRVSIASSMLETQFKGSLL